MSLGHELLANAYLCTQACSYVKGSFFFFFFTAAFLVAVNKIKKFPGAIFLRKKKWYLDVVDNSRLREVKKMLSAYKHYNIITILK